MIPSVDWWITSHCTLKCDFCYGPVPGKDPVELRGDILNAILGSSAQCVSFCGGEPMIVRQVNDYAQQLRNHGMRTILNTNGELLLRLLNSTKSSLPYDVIGISLDGGTGDTHRNMRGTRARFIHAVASARIIRTRQPETKLKIGTVVSKVNAHTLKEELFPLMLFVRPDVWRLYQYAERGAYNRGIDRHRISTEDFNVIVSELRAELEWLGLSETMTIAPATATTGAGCMIIDMNGDVMLPSASGYVKRGNCLETDLDEIWEELPERDAVIQNKQWHSITLPPSAPREPRSASAPREPRASAPAS